MAWALHDIFSSPMLAAIYDIIAFELNQRKPMPEETARQEITQHNQTVVLPFFILMALPSPYLRDSSLL